MLWLHLCDKFFVYNHNITLSGMQLKHLPLATLKYVLFSSGNILGSRNFAITCETLSDFFLHYDFMQIFKGIIITN